MLSVLEAKAALTGLGLLLRFNAGFALWFDRSAAGALRSFRLMLVVLPCFIVIVLVALAQEPAISMVRLITASATIYLLSWILFPLCLILIGRAMEREPQAIGAITFYNWYCASILVVQSALSLLAYSEVLGDGPEIVSRILFYAALLFEGFALRVLLGLGYSGILVLVLLEYSISEGLTQIWIALLLARPFF